MPRSDRGDVGSIPATSTKRIDVSQQRHFLCNLRHSDDVPCAPEWVESGMLCTIDSRFRKQMKELEMEFKASPYAGPYFNGRIAGS